MRIVLLSDTHSLHNQLKVPDGDLLIHAGDMTRRGACEELADFDRFLAGLPHRYKVVIAGNRDFCLERDFARSRALLAHAEYLQDTEITVEGIRIYGTPWQPEFLSMAFNLPRGESLRKKWALVPEGVDILVTHTPPYGIGDRTNRGALVGDEELTAALPRIHPRMNVFGHIHEGYGRYAKGGVDFFNVSVVDAAMQVCNAPIVVDWPLPPDTNPRP